MQLRPIWIFTLLAMGSCASISGVRRKRASDLLTMIFTGEVAINQIVQLCDSYNIFSNLPTVVRSIQVMQADPGNADAYLSLFSVMAQNPCNRLRTFEGLGKAFETYEKTGSLGSALGFGPSLDQFLASEMGQNIIENVFNKTESIDAINTINSSIRRRPSNQPEQNLVPQEVDQGERFMHGFMNGLFHG